MATAINRYLAIVRDNLRLVPSAKQEVLSELESHIEDRFEELREKGLSDEEAAKSCIGLLGSAKMVARQIYEAHSQGSWKQTLLASMPHLLFALLFALNWWQDIGWLLIAPILVVGIAIYGWRHNKPTWLFPWLGYSLVPLIAAGLLLLYLPRGWSWLAILLYIPLVLWLVGSIIIQTLKRDWLYSTLMLLPVPVILSWFLAVWSVEGFPQSSLQRLQDFAPGIGLSFLALAATAAIFIRLRQRALKVTALLTSGLLTLVMVAYYAEGRLSLIAFLILILLMVSLFLIPPWMERGIGYGDEGDL